MVCHRELLRLGIGRAKLRLGSLSVQIHMGESEALFATAQFMSDYNS